LAAAGAIERFFVFAQTRYLYLTIALLGFAAVLPRSAGAVSVEVARACDALVAKSFPPRQPGNPAAGSAAGSAKEQRAYFQKCVENGGKMDSGSAKDGAASKPK